MPPSPELLLSLTPSVLRSLVSTFSSPGRPLPVPAHATARDIARVLFTSVPSAKLDAVLAAVLGRFSTRGGRLALVEAARATEDPRAELWLSEPAADVAALLAVERATSKTRARRAATRLFALASHRVERDLPERPTYELLAERAVARDSASVVPRLERALGKRLVEAWSAKDDDGALRVALFLRQPTENRLTVDGASTRIDHRRDVPVAVDLVRVAPDGARVAITTAMPDLLPTYASALALSLLSSLTLRPLHDLTPARLAALAIPRVARVEVVAVRFRHPDGARFEVRAADALDPSRHGQRTGYIDRATIRVTVDGDVRVDVFLQLPHRVEISDRALEEPVRAALTALGIFAPGSLPDDARSLAPYEHGEWRWRTVLPGAAFDLLRKNRRVAHALSSHVVTREHRMHGAAYIVRDVPGEPDVQYALAEDRSLGARVVGPKDRVAWRLDLDALAAAMRSDLGAKRVDPKSSLTGMLDLGVVSLPSGKLRFVYAMAEPPEGWMDAIRRACPLGVTPVVLVRRGHAAAIKGMVTIELDVEEQLGARGIGRVLGRAAEALGVPDEVEAWRRCDEDVVVEQATRHVWVMRVRVLMKERPFGLVLHLAKRGGEVVATKELGSRISSAGTPDVTARKAKAEAEAQIREALDDAGIDSAIVDGLILVEGRKGYRLGVAARVV